MMKIEINRASESINTNKIYKNLMPLCFSKITLSKVQNSVMLIPTKIALLTFNWRFSFSLYFSS
jgi:hypothetical protein